MKDSQDRKEEFEAIKKLLLDLKRELQVAIIAAMLLVFLGLALTGLSFYSTWMAQLYLSVIDAYDNGALLVVMGALGIICCLAGVYGLVILREVTVNPRVMKRLDFMIMFYVGWGIFLAITCIVCAALVTLCALSLEKLFQAGFIEVIDSYGTDSTVTKAIDKMQSELECCGSSIVDDWFYVVWSPNNSLTDHCIPESCCPRQPPCVKAVAFGDAKKLTAFPTGCRTSAAVYLKWILLIRAAVLGACGPVQAVVAGIFARELYLLKKKKGEDEEDEEEEEEAEEEEEEGEEEDADEENEDGEEKEEKEEESGDEEEDDE